MPHAQSASRDSGRCPVVGYRSLDDVAAYRRGVPVTARRFLGDVARAAAALPATGHMLNLCSDRYRFAVALLAALARGHATLLPPATTPNLVRAMRAFAPDAYFVSDAPGAGIDLPRVVLPSDPQAGDAAQAPSVAASQVAAIVFTSGSTGEPQPHEKRWGALVRNVSAEAARLGIAGAGHAILGTVPPQHMFGLESTVLLPLVSGAALTAERPFFPAEIDAAIGALPPARTLFTTPFHLRNWLAGGQAARLERIVSATAPLSARLAQEVEARTGATLLEIYGCTETGQLATRRPTLSPDWEAYDGVRLQSDGETVIASGGHIESPTALADLIEVGADGRHFRLLGRSADMVNIAGKRNSLGYLDHQLTAIDGVVDGAFFIPDEDAEDGVTRLMAFAVAPGLTAAEILAGLRARIDPVFLPRPLLLVESLPRRPTGKLPREALLELAARARREPEAR
jgi:acyl-coenzyme A synthetase/AMP-(fatty) acid ligase